MPRIPKEHWVAAYKRLEELQAQAQEPEDKTTYNVPRYKKLAIP